MNTATMKLSVLFLSLFILSCQSWQTARIPDFQTKDISLLQNHLVARIQNNGATVYEGDLQLRVIIAKSLSEGHTFDKIFTVTNTWGPGEIKQIIIVPDLIPQNWPDLRDYPQKTVAVMVDFGNQIAEIDENNNRLETLFNVPCSAQISHVDPETIVWQGLGHQFSLDLQGQFGEIQRNKNIKLQTENGNAGLTFQNIQWHPNNIGVTGRNLHFIPGGCYNLFIDCAAPDPYNNHYTSNVKVVCVEGDPDSDPDDPSQCPTPIQIEGWRYTGPPADCWSEYLIRSAGSLCDANGWYCCMQNADAQGSARCNPGYQEMIPPCCRSSEMTCDSILKQPYGCYERDE